jgi:septum formation protein
MKPPQLILASASPRRRELLAQIGIVFDVYSVEADETPRPGETPEDYVIRVAAEKSQLAQQALGSNWLILGADTEVVLDGQVFGKPGNFAHAQDMLTRLSGREHQVLSAVSLRQCERHWQTTSRSRVEFRPLSPAEIEAYWATGEPQGKAGAYAIQGIGAAFIQRLNGSYSGVMGLPVFETAQLLREAGIDVFGGLASSA